jgi:hypothetical protein
MVRKGLKLATNLAGEVAVPRGWTQAWAGISIVPERRWGL